MTESPDTGAGPLIDVDGLVAGYARTPVIDGLDLRIPTGSFTAVIGPNACGKSTLLRNLARLMTPTRGTILLDGREIADLGTREMARRVGLLPQAPVTPDGITVYDLVSRGRYPHQTLLAQWSRADREAVERAIDAAGVGGLRDRRVDELSGGQRQRVWIALVLAQETDVLLLDEPTTYLDIAHQVEILELAEQLRAGGRTVVAVLHELGHAARYASHIVAMRDGAIVAEGSPHDVVTEELIRRVFDLRARVITDPDDGTPVVLPRAVVRD